MGDYYGVSAVEKIGTKVKATGNSQPSFYPDEALIFITNNGAYEIAVDVTRKSEWEEFYNQYRGGWLLSFRLYKVKITDLANCPDEGRRYLL